MFIKSIVKVAFIAIITTSSLSFASKEGKERMIPHDSPTSKGTMFIPASGKGFKKASPYKGVLTYKYNFNNGLFTIWEFKEGAFVPAHVHDSDQITYMMEGEVRIVQGSDKKEFIFKKGDTFVLPAHIYHYLEALKESKMVGVNPATTEGKSKTFKH